MELDDLDEPEPTSTDELTSSTTFVEEQSVQITIVPPPVSSLYNEVDDEETSIPTESHLVSSYCFIFHFYHLYFRNKVMILTQFYLW